MRQEIGLGAATAIKRVEIIWPKSHGTQILTGLSLDRAYSIKEGSLKAAPLDHKRVNIAF